jgi:hypothetical protein
VRVRAQPRPFQRRLRSPSSPLAPSSRAAHLNVWTYGHWARRDSELQKLFVGFIDPGRTAVEAQDVVQQAVDASEDLAVGMTAGAGIVFGNRFQLDGAISVSRSQHEIALSFVTRFPR